MFVATLQEDLVSTVTSLDSFIIIKDGAAGVAHVCAEYGDVSDAGEAGGDVSS